MAMRVIDDTKLNDIAVAIQAKDNGGQMTVDEMPTRIENIPTGWANPTPFVMVSDMQYADEIMPIVTNICPNHGQWFIAKKDYANKQVANYTFLGAVIVYTSDNTSIFSSGYRSTSGWSFSAVNGHFAASTHAGDIFYIYDISSIT